MSVIKIENLHFSYGNMEVLNDLNLEVKKGENTIIIGDNGSGKSTLLKLMLGELQKDSGSIKLMGEDIETIKNYDLVGYVPQIQIANQIAFPLTCLEMVVLNKYKEFGFIKIPNKAAKEKAKEILVEMGLKDYINTPVNQLSGGLKQRTMIARALMNDPEVLILDEPTVGIDQKSKSHFIKMITDMSKKRGLTLILVTHELEYILENLERCLVYKLERGKLVNAGI